MPRSLVVVAPDPPAVVRRLGSAAQRSTLVVPTEPGTELAGLPAGLAGTTDIGGSGWDCVRVPLDGPVGALVPALSGLRQHLGDAAARTCALLECSPPPPPGLLARAAATGLTPAVSVADGGWVSDTSVWLSGPGGVTELPYDVRDHAQSRALAANAVALCVLPDGSPITDWVRAIAVGTLTGSPPEWATVLTALYLELVVAVLAGADV